MGSWEISYSLNGSVSEWVGVRGDRSQSRSRLEWVGVGVRAGGGNGTGVK